MNQQVSVLGQFLVNINLAWASFKSSKNHPKKLTIDHNTRLDDELIKAVAKDDPQVIFSPEEVDVELPSLGDSKGF